MPEVQEVFQMATQKVRPDPDALERQHRGQRRHVAKKKAAVFALITVLAVGGGAFAISALRSGERTTDTGTTVAPTAIPPVTAGKLEAGTYAISTLDREFDASYRITMEIPDGYQGSAPGWEVSKIGRPDQQSVEESAWVIGDVYRDPCRWRTTKLGQSASSSVDALVAALGGQRGVRTSTPTDVTVDGYAGKYMERTLPAGTNLNDCNGDHFRPWLGTDGGRPYLHPGQRDLLWIVDVDGVPLVIDASLGAGTSVEDQAESVQIVGSIRIDPL